MGLTVAQQGEMLSMYEGLQQQLQACQERQSNLIAMLQDGRPIEPDGDSFASRYLLVRAFLSSVCAPVVGHIHAHEHAVQY